METFVVRIFTAVETGNDRDLRGKVEHVGSGASRTFHSLDELSSFLQQSDRRLIDRDNPS